MGKGNSNKSRNAFYFFMLDFKNQQGRNFNTMADAAAAAGPHWQRLSAAQKEKYQALARRNKENPEKQTSLGISIDYVLHEEKQKMDRELSVKEEIDNIVKGGVNTNTIADHYFYLMHFNEFLYWEKGCRYYPAEVAIGKFNLRNGIKTDEVYHAFVHPGPLPMGYSAIVKLKSEETHQIPHMGARNNMEEVISKIMAKLTENTDSDTLPPIYVDEKDMLMIENILGWMCQDLGHPNLFYLYSLQYLLFSLRNNVSLTGAKVWPTISVSKLALEKDLYDFANGIACAYHDQAEMPLYCSRSHVIRWVYIVCDNCVGELKLPIIKGQHIPINCCEKKGKGTEASGVSSGHEAANSVSVASSKKSYNKHSDVPSETSTIVDESEISSYHGFDSDSQVADDDLEWRRPRRPHSRYKTPQNLSQKSDTTINLSQASSTSDYVPGRRPTSQSSANPEHERGNSAMIRRGRGRGRGVLQTRPPV